MPITIQTLNFSSQRIVTLETLVQLHQQLFSLVIVYLLQMLEIPELLYVEVEMMLLYGGIFGCLSHILSIVAFLSYRSPFIHPKDEKQNVDRVKLALLCDKTFLIFIMVRLLCLFVVVAIVTKLEGYTEEDQTKLSRKDVQRMQWEVLEAKIGN